MDIVQRAGRRLVPHVAAAIVVIEHIHHHPTPHHTLGQGVAEVGAAQVEEVEQVDQAELKGRDGRNQVQQCYTLLLRCGHYLQSEK